ncbi:MAG: hypothetical protein A2660_00445 [Candidatus Doudnabacteria bacterium RIFCSPHIGHO2_01_FULL_45_18]|uniref:PPM-type phosphatase domain-containing protein n=1 Tax=Candidatus Doudnabacteria bacterium RIFCSPHIGHO2_01_FULL_45_18 TaxID=1817823 RepID=A0A1F5NRD6_9BACT|nr:MAG: hypothetical protein A2660_00445 [Candidatus Doudnabacteria bacterium RIFCSPHIGHO2_01_FULL_45_18]
MSKLDTQINQIYLSPPQNKKTSLILYEEALSTNSQVFILAQLKDLLRKSEANDLKRISEIILTSFRNNKKLPGETLFEQALSQVNQNLADLAHEGHKSWVGKFSCLICLKSGDDIYLANDGLTSAWLLRRGEVLEILPAEKLNRHPLKTFQNFTQGKLKDNDGLIITTANIFDYVSLELFGRLLNQYPLPRACDEISKILRDSLGIEQAFCTFLLQFSRKIAEAPVSMPLQMSYAPLPEDIAVESPGPRLVKLHLPKINLKGLKFPQFHWQYFKNLTRAGKFFFISFTIFLLMFVINLGFYALKINAKKTQDKINTLVTQINTDIDNTQSALIYKNDDEAQAQLKILESDWATLQQLSQDKADEVGPKVEQIKNQVNKINIITNPKVYVDLKRHPIFLAKSPSGFLFANQDSNSLSLFAGNLNDYFLLNSLKNNITSIAHFTPAGVVVSTNNELHRIDTTLKQFELMMSISDADIISLKTYATSLYALDKNDQIVKITGSNNKYQTQVSARGEFNEARDFSLDKDIYVLFPDHMIKYVSGQPQAFPLPAMSDSLTNATKLSVASNIYILEANKKRLLIVSKQGALINQIYFPTTGSLTDFSVDEAQRSIYLLDDNKLFKITF